ncbi:cell division protein ZapA [Larkinella soli]|uniref:cell division protein ZapA n=1 Tax=Larkinella soli TaxID=1770527 RepID=UPI000FFCA119|nr:cell division protein ZapA [Larkinella soli]
MEEFLSIHIRIAGRNYPVTVHPDQEAVTRDAGRFVNERLQEEQKRKKKRDDQDILAETAVLSTVGLLTERNEKRALQEKLTQRITRLHELIDSVLTT